MVSNTLLRYQQMVGIVACYNVANSVLRYELATDLGRNGSRRLESLGWKRSWVQIPPSRLVISIAMGVLAAMLHDRRRGVCSLESAGVSR